MLLLSVVRFGSLVFVSVVCLCSDYSFLMTTGGIRKRNSSDNINLFYKLCAVYLFIVIRHLSMEVTWMEISNFPIFIVKASSVGGNITYSVMLVGKSTKPWKTRKTCGIVDAYMSTSLTLPIC